ncbi:MAG TPA: phosphoribosylformylglycinamidine synthase subunit PurS [Candidatus Methanoperedenaceae archaeon]|nr:phosphoribosylformylglycinamidine synthase subunit PurS [Candidatus Methanoperedenaceae archaeon]
MLYRAEITVGLKKGMLDPEGTTIRRALGHIGYKTESLRTAKQFLIELDAGSEEAARSELDEMCRRLLANPVIHTYTIKLEEA